MSAAVAGASAEGRASEGEPDGHRIMKRDTSDNDIKDYAETTMNELLGWYGYDKLDTRGMNLKSLRHPFPATSSSSSSPTRPEDDASEDDTGHSASPTAENEYTSTNASGGNTIVCAWCLKMGLKLFTLKTTSGETKEFCSETCFNQCRRAAFKKNRVCNWCRHVRHTVNYVDFQDGDDQLQFCSDKCLNQYKMQIFCRETQAYLQMNPHLQEETSKNPASSKLITPDLWLRDCHEPSNGAVSSSGDELHSRLNDKHELEDLSATSKSEHSPLTNHSLLQDRETLKNVTTSVKDSLSEKCNAFAPFRDDEDKMERRKRHHEIIRDSYRKRQRIPSFRNKAGHLAEAPPAHLSSTASSLSFPKHSPLFPPTSTSFPLPLRSKSPVHVSPPAAHSKSFTPHPGLTTNPVLHPGLPPPPPLLNNDYFHSHFNPQMFPPHHQQLDAVLRMQAGFAPNSAFSPNLLHDSMLPLLRGTAQQSTSSIPQPNTVMLPFPIFVPLPIPIPIPLPLRSFLPKEIQVEQSKTLKEHECGSKTSDSKAAENTNDATKISKTAVTEDSSSVLTGSRNQAAVSSAADSDLSEKIARKHKKR